jgi:microsomal dipeptidase-like Zn-dependent dipeptidase
LIGPDDLARYRSEPADALTWGVLVVAGFDYLITSPADLDHLANLYRRGVRVFQLLSGPDNALGGSDQPDDERGLTALGRNCLERIAELATRSVARSRPLIDLAHHNVQTMGDILDWIAAEPARTDALFPIHSHACGQFLASPEQHPRALECLARVRSSGGIVAIDPDGLLFPTLAHFQQAISSLASLPAGAATSHEGIGVSTNYLALDQVPRGLEDVDHLIGWLSRSFEPDVARELIAGNAMRLLERAVYLRSQ